MKSLEQFPLLLNCEFPTKGEYLSSITDALHKDTLTHIVTLNAEMVVEAQKNEDFKKAVLQAELKVPDGSSMLWARKYIKQKRNIAISLIAHLFSPEQPLTGVDSVFDICELVDQIGGAVYLLGGTEEQAEGTLNVLQQKYPTLTIQRVEEDLPKSSKPVTLFVAYGSPKQTLWIEERRTFLEQAGVRVAVGVGGAFAMISGILPRAPKAMRRFHLEWVWRLILEPKRIQRIWNAVVVFPSLVHSSVSKR
jgi:N-acetylglucosaminyldiphosphoundecaprenol N-acetyl-beta-D-mannosaminyltransferase